MNLSHSCVCVSSSHVTGKACFVGQTQADDTGSECAVVLAHMIGSLRATCQPWWNPSLHRLRRHNLDATRAEAAQTGRLRGHERDAKQHETNISLSQDGREEDVATRGREAFVKAEWMLCGALFGRKSAFQEKMRQLKEYRGRDYGWLPCQIQREFI